MGKKRLFVDMDGTLCRFHDEVNYLERMYEEGFFLNLKPFENMCEGINLFIERHPDVGVYGLSACVDSPFCISEKQRWMVEVGKLYIPKDHLFFAELDKPKASYIPGGITKDDYLLDDYNKGLNQFLYDGGSAIKCHNNINQLGLGAHGGFSGNLWVGPMVHVKDTPELIAAELAQHMGLEYDLEHVVASYDGIALNPSNFTSGLGTLVVEKTVETVEITAHAAESQHQGHRFSNPLNAIRYLAGSKEFLEYTATDRYGTSVSAPVFQLRAISSNLYGNSSFEQYLQADEHQFAEAVRKAEILAKQAMVGQIEFLYPGGIGDCIVYRDMNEMQREIQASQDCGRPINVTWFIPPKVPTIHELTSFLELADRLYYEHGFDSNASADIAQALLTPYENRTEEQMQLLMEAWHTHELPGTLWEFLRITEEQLQAYMLHARDLQKQGRSPSLNDKITKAKNRAASTSRRPETIELEADEYGNQIR